MREIDPFQVRYSAVKHRIKIDIDDLREFVQSSESLMKSEVKKFTDWLDKKAESLSTEEKEYLIGWHSDTYWQLSDIFPRIQRSSLLIISMSFLESRLNQLCDLYIDKKSPNDIKLSDFKGSGIERAVLFLRKVPKLQIDTNTKTWEAIKTFQKIRNYLVHADDSPITNDADVKTFKKFSKEEGGIKIDERNRIILQPTILNQMLNVTQRLFMQIFDTIENSTLKINIERKKKIKNT